MNLIIILYIGLALILLLIVTIDVKEKENMLAEELGVENPREVFQSEREKYFAGLAECDEKFDSKSSEWNACYELVKESVNFRP